MDNSTTFSDVLEAAEKLTLDEQETLLHILHRRIVQQRRGELVAEQQQARHDFQQGQCRPATPDELIREIAS